MPRSYWTYDFAAAVYLINRLPTLVLNMTTPFNKLFKTDPNYNQLKVFRCLCFPWLKPYASHKLENISTPCVFLGYSHFFFQAEDGIRGFHVTGVQTCALPI